MPRTGARLIARETPVLLACTPEETAGMLRIARSKIYKLLAAGELDSYMVGRSRRIPRASIDAYIARQVAAEHERRRAQKGGAGDVA